MHRASDMKGETMLDLIVLFSFVLIFFVPIILYEKFGWFKGSIMMF